MYEFYNLDGAAAVAAFDAGVSHVEGKLFALEHFQTGLLLDAMLHLLLMTST